MQTDRSPLGPEVLERLGVDGHEPEHCEPAHLAAEPYEPDTGDAPDPAHAPASDLDGSTPYEH